MKRRDDPRHLRRIKILEELFADTFHSDALSDYHPIVEKIKQSYFRIDPLIEKAAPEYPVDKIAKIDAAILRLAIFEILFDRKEPVKVIIDEAIELAKEYGGDGSPGFINGVLGNIVKNVSNEKGN